MIHQKMDYESRSKCQSETNDIKSIEYYPAGDQKLVRMKKKIEFFGSIPLQGINELLE